MAFVTITVPAQGTATKLSQLQQIKDNDDALNDALGIGKGIINGSFEVGSGANAPPGWDRTTWGTAGYDTANPMHGSQAYYFESTGAGGGKLTSTDFIECSEYDPVILLFMLRSSVVDIRNIVKILFYDKDQSALSPGTLYDDNATNPTSDTLFVRVCNPPAGSRFMKVELTFADSSDATSGKCTMDGVRFLEKASWSITGKTISEQTVSVSSYTDAGSFTLDLGPLSANSLVLIRLTAEAKNASGSNVGQRFRVGTAYSNAITDPAITTAGYNTFAYQILLGGATGVITIYQQLLGNGAATYGRKLDGVVSVEVLVP